MSLSACGAKKTQSKKKIELSELKEDRRIHILMDYGVKGISKISADSVSIKGGEIEASGNVVSEYTFKEELKAEKEDVEVNTDIKIDEEESTESDRKRPIPLWIIIVSIGLFAIGIRNLLNRYLRIL